MFERWDVLEASVGEWNAEVAFGWSAPAKGAAETMEVVVVGEAAQGRLGLRKAFEQVPVENLALKDLPEGLDLAVGPGRRDLCAKVPDIQIPQSLPEAGGQPGIQTTKGLPLSLMSCSGVPQSSKQSSSHR